MSQQENTKGINSVDSVGNQLSLESLKAEFSCSICFQCFSTELNAPMTPFSGTCGHSFCRGCILKCLEMERQRRKVGRLVKVSCPVCQKYNAFHTNQWIPNVALCKIFDAVVPFVKQTGATKDTDLSRSKIHKRDLPAVTPASITMQPRQKRRRGFASATVERPFESAAIAYVASVKRRFADNPELYQSFLEIVSKHQHGTSIGRGLMQALKRVFKEHPDLLDGFVKFLPDRHQQEA